MTHKFSKYLILAVGALGLSALPALADPACNNQAVVNGFACSLGDLTFTFESVSLSGVPPGSLSLIAPPATEVNGNDTVLAFQYTGGGLPADFNLVYEVTTNDGADTISAIDSSFPTPANGGGDITEDVCTSNDPIPSGCSTVEIASDNKTGITSYSSSFGPLNTIWITKDVTDPSPGFTSFTDSVVTTPEPSSEAAVLGLGLVAFLLWKRRASAAA